MRACTDTVGILEGGARRALLVCAVAFVCACYPSATAQALGQRGHEFKPGLSFGSSGEAGTTLSEPGGVAVSEFTGDVYVLDRGHNRIVQFAPKLDGQGHITAYKFVSAWGWAVNAGGKKYEVCTEHCRAGAAGAKAYEFNHNVLGVAVDNCTATNADGEAEREPDGRLKPCPGDPSAGDVYVASEYYDAKEEEDYEGIDKFEPNGTPVERIDKLQWQGEEPGGPGCEEKHKKTICVEGELSPEESHGLTVDPEGTPWLYYQENLFALNDVKLSEASRNHAPLSVNLPGSPPIPAPGLAKDGRGHFYIGHIAVGGNGQRPDVMSKWEAVENEHGGEELEEGATAPAGLDTQDTTAIAVNPLDLPGNQVDEQNDVYITNLESGEGGKATTIAQFTPEGKLIQRLNAAGFKDGAGIAVDPADGAIFASDAEAGDIDLFTLAEPGAPAVDGIAVQDVTAESAQLQAQIDPGDEETRYLFEYGTTPCATGSSSCVQVGGTLPAGYGDQSVVAHLQRGAGASLQPGTTYHYRVVARNNGGEAVSEERAFSTPAASGEYAADARGWEMVSSPDKDGANVEPVAAEKGGLVQAAADGAAISYIATGPFAEPEGSRDPEPAQILSTRGAAGWSSKDITTPSSPGLGLTLGIETEYEFFSEDLSLAVLTPFHSINSRFATPPLAPPVSATEEQRKKEEEHEGEPLEYQENTIYMRDDKGVEPQGELETPLYEELLAHGKGMDNPGYVALVNGADAPGVEFGVMHRSTEHTLQFLAATPDLSHVLIEAGVPLLSGETGKGLYEWSWQARGRATLVPVNILPAAEGGGAVAGTLGRGGEKGGAPSEGSTTFRHAISDDGSRVVWSSEGHGLYMRDTASEETLRIAGAGAEFQTASADGSQVFFTDSERLTSHSGEAGKPDLYVCEVGESTATHRLEECTVANGRLVDLTPEYENAHHEVESADVQGLALGASEDGSYVYFVAGGALSESSTQSDFCDAVSQASFDEGGSQGPQAVQVPAYPEETCNLYVVHYSSEAKEWETPRFIAALSTEDEHDWRAWRREEEGGEEEQSQGELTSRVSPNGQYVAFMSDMPLTGYDNDATALAADGAPAEEVYLYNASTEGLVCASCAPSGEQPVGMRVPLGLSRLLVDETASWQNRWLAASLPEAASIVDLQTDALYQSRYLSDSGRLFFNSPEALVPSATNHEEDVYEYEPVGVPRGRHACTTSSATYSASAEGCIGLISSGASTSESVFLDASETGGEGPHGEELSEGGGDAFFMSAAKLVPEDTEEAFAAYDAHECTSASPCIVPPEEKPPASCETSDECRPYTPSSAGLASAPASATSNPSSNLAAKQSVLASQTQEKAKPLTRAQELALALKQCRLAHRHSSRKRKACEQQARKKYGGSARKSARTARPSAHTGRAR